MSEWAAFYQLEPWGYRPETWRSGLVASSIYNVNRSKKSSKMIKPEDFIPQEKYGPCLDDGQLREKIHGTFQHIAAAMKGRA